MIEGIVFDLDGTLYDNDGMDLANKRAIVRAIAEQMKITEDEAQEMLERALGKYSSSEGRPSLYGAALQLGVADELIESFQLEHVIPAKILSADPELAREIERLSGIVQLALMTNTRTTIAAAAIQALGIPTHAFAIIRGGDQLARPKPSAFDLLMICKELNIKPEQCVSVGDRWSVDLAPAHEIGMQTKEVDGRDELYEWLCGISV